mmetsp:Transcript_2377/g.5036  ORF Transcript_2377/g.5036 Transcript_2377/m.5036 type:complete len:711 (+) Transcript_2377:266-2398(+)
MRPRHGHAALLRRRSSRTAAFWITFGLLAILIVIALEYRCHSVLHTWDEGHALDLARQATPHHGGRQLEEDDDEGGGISAYFDDPLIDKPYRSADNKYWIWVHIIVIGYMLLGLNTVCDAYFTGALDTMVDRWNIKPDVAGATFMAAGGSAPELFTSLIGATISESDVGFGTIVGSAVFNVLFVIGLCGFAASEPIKLTWWPLARDCTYYIFGLSLLALFAKTGGEIELWEACILFIGYICYCTLMYFNENIEALVMKTPLLPATGCSAQPPSTAPSIAKMPTDDMMLKLTQVTPVGDTGGSAGFEFATPEIEIPAVTVTPAAPAGAPPQLPTSPPGGVNGSCTPGASTPRSGLPHQEESAEGDHRHHHNHHHAADGEHRHHHHIKKSQPHFARHNHANGEMAGTLSGTLSAMLRKPSERSPSNQGSAKAGSAWPAPAVVGDARKEDPEEGTRAEEAQASKDCSEKEAAAAEEAPATAAEEDLGADELMVDDDGDLDSEEEDDIEALLIMPDAGLARVVWIMSLPIYAPLYYLTPKPTARWFLATFGISLLWIAGFSTVLVYCVEVLGEVMRIHIIIMGFTLLAAGTSIPDAVSSVAVARAGEGDMAVSSSIGSNIFDILVGLPIPWIIKIGFVEMVGKGKSDFAVKITSDYIVLYVLILVAMVFAVILGIHLIGWVLNKTLGACMGLLYCIFLTTVLSVEFDQPSALKF